MTPRHQERRYEEGALIYEEEDVAEAAAMCHDALEWAERLVSAE